MIRRNDGGAPRSLRIAAGALFVLGIGGLSLAIASNESGEESARIELVRQNEAQELVDARRAAEAARSEIERLNRIRANQFQELVALRREAASLHMDLETAVTARAEADAAEIARLNRVRQNLFEELVGTRRELAAAQARLQTAMSAPGEAEVTGTGQQTGSLARQSPAMGAQRLSHQSSAEAPSRRRLRGPVPTIASRASPGSSSITKASSQRGERMAPSKPNAAVRAEVRRTPQALPSVLMLHGSAN
jgi:hypothetical protein